MLIFHNKPPLKLYVPSKIICLKLILSLNIKTLFALIILELDESIDIFEEVLFTVNCKSP